MLELGPIDDFRGDHRWLSNFHLCDIEYEGLLYPSTEHAYQAAKSLDVGTRDRVRLARKPRDAKSLGSKLALRDDWELVRIDVMLTVTRLKYEHPELRELLLATGKRQLVEGNWWHDNFWGDCRCDRPLCRGQLGENHLGRVIMRIRDEIAGGR